MQSVVLENIGRSLSMYIELRAGNDVSMIGFPPYREHAVDPFSSSSLDSSYCLDIDLVWMAGKKPVTLAEPFSHHGRPSTILHPASNFSSRSSAHAQMSIVNRCPHEASMNHEDCTDDSGSTSPCRSYCTSTALSTMPWASNPLSKGKCSMLYADDGLPGSSSRSHRLSICDFASEM